MGQYCMPYSCDPSWLRVTRCSMTAFYHKFIYVVAFYPSMHSKVMSYVSSNMFSLWSLFLIPHLGFNVWVAPSYFAIPLAMETNKFACQYPYQIMKSSQWEMIHNLAASIHLKSVFLTHLFIYEFKGVNCCNCQVILIISVIVIFFAEASSVLGSSALYSIPRFNLHDTNWYGVIKFPSFLWVDLLLWLAAIKIKQGGMACNFACKLLHVI